MITGSAPIDVAVLELLKVCFCAPIIEAYGLTETGGGSTFTSMFDNQTGNVGGPSENTKIRLKDIPEMNYYSSD